MSIRLCTIVLKNVYNIVIQGSFYVFLTTLSKTQRNIKLNFIYILSFIQNTDSYSRLAINGFTYLLFIKSAYLETRLNMFG